MVEEYNDYQEDTESIHIMFEDDEDKADDKKKRDQRGKIARNVSPRNYLEEDEPDESGFE